MSRPRVGFDARFYVLGGSGLSRYTQELLQHVLQLKLPYDLVPIIRVEDEAVFRKDHPRLEYLTTSIPHYSIREQVSLAKQLRQGNFDLVHFTNFNFPTRYRGKFVTTIHDLTLFDFAGRSKLSRLKSRPMRYVMNQAAHRSAAVITISEHQKKLITKAFDISPAKVAVIYEAVDPAFKPLPAREIAAFRQQQGLQDPFLMYAGEWRPHKNLVRLFKAMAKLQATSRVKLVIVGKLDPAFPIIPNTVKELGIEDRVLFTDFVSNQDLHRYFASADAFVFPSLAEGFGLPPLEAMASGTPVISSQAPPMPEILGTAATYFNPRSTAAMVEAIETTLRSQPLRQKLVTAGLKQAGAYSWAETARQTAAAYDRALAE